MQVTFLRGVASLPPLLAANAVFGHWRDLIPKRWHLHVLRGFLSVSLLWCFIYAVSQLSLANTYTIFMSAPLLDHGVVGADARRACRLATVARGVGRPRRRNHRPEAERHRSGHDRRSRGAGVRYRLRAQRDHDPHPHPHRQQCVDRVLVAVLPVDHQRCCSEHALGARAVGSLAADRRTRDQRSCSVSTSLRKLSGSHRRRSSHRSSTRRSHGACCSIGCCGPRRLACACSSARSSSSPAGSM